ncbi:MAG: 4Fe-4S dicluster domain-containing protein [Desulfobacteraceae bacterium]|nr:4Fe-4S dicluster domain-containing protein [Desulfobacteraceae bacterium]
MATTYRIPVADEDLPGALRAFLQAVLSLPDINAVLAPGQLPMKNTVMPMLVSDPEQLAVADPLAPYFPLNGAKLVSRLTRKPSGGKIAAVLRSCEIRAFVELVKLHQGIREDVLIVGIDCLGALNNTDYARFAGEAATEETTRRFYRSVLDGDGGDFDETALASACQACELPTPEGADIGLALFGVNTRQEILAETKTDAGEAALERLELEAAETPAGRADAVRSLVARRKVFRDAMFKRTQEATGTLEDLTRYLAGCVNCYNCRVACPVCYCRECVFVTDVFDHEPDRYLRWAERRGAMKMPTDTVFYHLTRLAHMSTACVGCGQCSNACPNDIPVMELFRATAAQTQAAFGYHPGRSLEERPPLSEFREDEFSEVVGIEG